MKKQYNKLDLVDLIDYIKHNYENIQFKENTDIIKAWRKVKKREYLFSVSFFGDGKVFEEELMSIADRFHSKGVQYKYKVDRINSPICSFIFSINIADALDVIPLFKKEMKRHLPELYLDNVKSIVFKGYLYIYEYKLAQHRKDLCLATEDPEICLNGFYRYSSKDPGDGKAYVIIYTDNPKYPELNL